MESADGKRYKTDSAKTETMFRVIQSIPSPNAEPFKRWFAKVANEKIQEIENPELAAERARKYYQELGYFEDWIAKRLQFPFLQLSLQNFFEKLLVEADS